MLTASATTHATTVTVDFESLYSSGTSNLSHGNTYIEDGMQIHDIDGEYELSTWGEAASGYNGSTAMFNNSREATTALTATSNGTFDLVSIDLSPLHTSYNTEEPQPDPSNYVYVTFVTNTGHSQSFDVGITDGNWVYDEFWEVWYSDTLPPVTTFYFDSGFEGVTSVTWIQNDPGLHQFDNIVAANVVPIPAAVWLFGSALAVLGWIRRKQFL
jgi:hypothetical protein